MGGREHRSPLGQPHHSNPTRTSSASTDRERRGPVLPDVNSCKLLARGSPAGVADTPDPGGPHGCEIAAGATCVAPARARGGGGSGARRGCHSRRPSTSTTAAAAAAAAAAAPPGPARPGPGRSCLGALAPLALQTTLRPAARRGGGALKGAGARRDSPAHWGTGLSRRREPRPGPRYPRLREAAAPAGNSEGAASTRPGRRRRAQTPWCARGRRRRRAAGTRPSAQAASTVVDILLPSSFRAPKATPPAPDSRPT